MLLDDVRQIADALVAADLLAVLNAGLHELARDAAIRVAAGDDQRPEEIALAAFVDAEVRREHLGIVHFLVAELRLAEHLGLQAKRHEFLRPLPLQHDLRPLLVDRHVQFVLRRVEERVRLRLEFVAVRHEHGAQLLRLRGRERRGVERERFFVFGHRAGGQTARLAHGNPKKSKIRNRCAQKLRRAGFAGMAAICPGGARTIPTPSWSRSSCSSRRRS